jgi:hypothetical protein
MAFVYMVVLKPDIVHTSSQRIEVSMTIFGLNEASLCTASAGSGLAKHKHNLEQSPKIISVMISRGSDGLGIQYG